MASSNSQIDKPERGRPKIAELLDVNINTGVQSINSERAPKVIKTLNILGTKYTNWCLVSVHQIK